MHCAYAATFSPSHQRSTFSSPPPSKMKLVLCPTREAKPPIVAFKIGVQEIAELAHNKVLVASALSCAIGQISKPFTSAINGNGIDFKAAIRSGGMPSTHSAAVVAAATSIGLERGFSDSIFGMSLVFASVVMYDAQGVRREVGYQAKILNKLQLESDLESESGASSINSKEVTALVAVSENPDSYVGKSEPYQLNSSGARASRLNTLPSLEVDIKEPSQKSYRGYQPLNESVGHNEIQVLVGAFLGFIVSFAVETIL
ncbi:hypothetical protein IEQ34_003784 [Dendrobium chrysotoxum]|uniref:Membrane protein YuiD n=1 Tax=Dendrobium chrysotoxum TaxID=161865 RepID=A0AAV7HC05_DENCH|nr:hypothetical protein IEQ34_003784 [Dendrobium chrysotoxum]